MKGWVAVASFVWMVLPAPVLGQTLRADRYAPTADGEGFVVSRAVMPQDDSFFGSAQISYAHDLVVVEDPVGSVDAEIASLVRHHAVVHLFAGGTMWSRLKLYGGLEVPFVSEGDSVVGYPSADGGGLGDLVFGAKALLVTRGMTSNVLRVGAEARAFLPLSNWAFDSSYNGENGFRMRALVSGEFFLADGLELQANAGMDFRHGANRRNYRMANDFYFAGGLSYRFDMGLALMSELWGTTSVQDFGSRVSSSIEALFGADYRFKGGIGIKMAVGTGMTRAFGTPDLRLVLGVSFAPKAVLNTARFDADHDRIEDSLDQCVDMPEDYDGFEDDDGCPEEDNDQDGLPDANDDCPETAEDIDGFDDHDGCPEVDVDSDGIDDPKDQCPRQAEDVDRFEDKDGCPDADNDLDGIADEDDQCPLQAGDVRGNGCPEKALLEVRKDKIVSRDVIEFAHDSGRLVDENDPILQEVLRVLLENENYTHILVEGHTDAEGRIAYNMGLSQIRAETVVNWLVKNGVSRDRLRAAGCGENIPLRKNTTRHGRQHNRRVEFHFYDRDVSQALRDDCIETGFPQ